MVYTTTAIPAPTFARAILDSHEQPVPQCIAHRGYKAKCPENTLLAFRAAIAAGAEALETDIHLTKDEVVVLSHDSSLKRCFGEDVKIIDRAWDEISALKTLAKPSDTLPRLLDLLDLLSEPGHEEIWCLLDIKIDNNADDVMRLLGAILTSHRPPEPQAKVWTDRIVLGIWTAKYLPLCLKYLPGFAIINIGFSITFSRHFLDIENVGFNMLFPKLIIAGGPGFVREARAEHQRQVLAWTVNKKDVMRWCISHGLDGVITDDPKLYLQTRDAFATETKPWLPLALSTLFHIVRVWIWVGVAVWFFRKRFGPVASKSLLLAQSS